MILPKAELAVIAFDAIRTGNIPIAKANASYDEYDNFGDNCDEIITHDISSIDGMNGHDFEYFCADILTEIQGIRHRKIEDLSFDDLIKFYQGVADLPQADIDTLSRIKNNRNAVHLIKHKELSSWKDYKLSVECFFSLLQTLLRCLPDLSDAKENYLQIQREIEAMCQ